MKKIELTKALALEQVLTEAKQEDVVLMRDGHAVALVSELDDDDFNWYLREQDPGFLSSLARARSQVKEGKTIRHEDLKRELGMG